MIKARTTALILGIFLLVGSAAMAQTDQHDVTIKVPNLLSVRILDGTGNNPASTPSVEFDYQTDPTAYIAAVNRGGGSLNPTQVSRFSDVVVFSNRSGWDVNVSASSIQYNDDYALSTTGQGIDLADIQVVPSGTTGTGVSANSSFDLATTTPIASGGRTQGWSSLGFSGADYRLAVNGDEDPGTYTTTVTFSITAN